MTAPPAYRDASLLVGSSLVGANAVAWLVALVLFRDQPGLMAAAGLAWGLGLRHALDPDHIAVIDNAVCAGIEAPGRTGGTGFGPGLWFALGHATIVVAACVLVAAVSASWRAELDTVRRAGTAAGPIVSASLLLVIAVANAASVLALLRPGSSARPRPALGTLSSLLRPLRRRIARGGSMYPVGLLMGLGFDTASEIALLALSAAQGGRGVPLSALLVFPALFAVGMAAVDAGNGWAMRRGYRWAAADPGRRRGCHLAITAASAAFAFAIAAWQLHEVFGERSIPALARDRPVG